MSFPDTPNKAEQRILSDVTEYGCHITSVFDPDGIEPSFAYSVGFSATVEHPEVIVFGLKNELMSYMINETLRQIRGGLRLGEGMQIEGLLEGYSVVSRQALDADAVSKHLCSAIWFWQRSNTDPMPMPFQLVWPGALDGLFPWDADCNQFVIDQQPTLYNRGLLH